jgi:glycosyltransferase involved in cell wall biosynthesis
VRRLLVNDQLTAIPGTRTFWHDLQEWFDMEFMGGDYSSLAAKFSPGLKADLIIRNATWFGPLAPSVSIPTISLLQDIFEGGPQREMQKSVLKYSRLVVFNSEFTRSKYKFDPAEISESITDVRVIPLPIDFSVFEPVSSMGLQQSLSLPDNCICWVGASQAAGQVKGFDIFMSIVRQNPDLSFVAVFKDVMPEYAPPNVRMYVRLQSDELAKVMGACRIGLCTSRMESQHLAGIEMGACGLSMVAPAVGLYWKRSDMPGVIVEEPTVENFSSAIRAALTRPGDPQEVRGYWETTGNSAFTRDGCRAAWARLIEEVES